MKIEWGRKSNSETAAVIPTADIKQARVQVLIKELAAAGVDSILVEDRLPEFRFSRSMNAGINELLKLENLRYIILSNDDICNIKGIRDMIARISEDENSYAQPYPNGKKPTFVVTRSRLRFVLNYALARRAPFHALRVMNGFHWLRKRRSFMMGAPAVLWDRDNIVGVQPFGIFNKSMLRNNKFDENFINGVEDDELGYRLKLAGARGITMPEWSVVHEANSSFKLATNGEKNQIGSYYITDEEMIRSAEYFYRKYFSGTSRSSPSTRGGTM